MWLMLLMAAALPSEGVAQARCEAALAAAEASYRSGAYEEVAGHLAACLGPEEPAEGAAPAFRLLALSFLGQEQAIPAKLAVVQLLGLVPGYQSDPIQDPPAYAALVEEVVEALRMPARCGSELEAAEPQYRAGSYAEVIGALAPCFEKGVLEEGDARRAYRLLALAHLNLGHLLEARQALADLLAAQPDYAPDRATDPPAYTALFTIIKRQQ